MEVCTILSMVEASMVSRRLIERNLENLKDDSWNLIISIDVINLVENFIPIRIYFVEVRLGD